VNCPPLTEKGYLFEIALIRSMKVGCITPRMFAWQPTDRKLFRRPATKDVDTKFACVSAHADTAANHLSAKHWYLRPAHAPPAIHYDGMLVAALWQRGEGMKQ